MATDLITVPARPEAVRRFLEAQRQRFLADLQEVRDLLEGVIASRPGLGCVYKVYSRGSQQAGEELKSAHKVRLKFDEFNVARGVGQASLFDVPDIVGLTVVVPYPSDISLVASALDDLVDAGSLVPTLPPSAPGGRIATRHGRGMEVGGYFACHYNVRLPAVAARPVCEIQIKTLLHDAWGAKTHDLTYKPAGRIGAELLASFELLGANLANLDQQSDVLRASIMRTAAVREAKRRRLQVALLREASAAHLSNLPDGQERTELDRIHASVGGLPPGPPWALAEQLLRRLLVVFPRARAQAARMLCYLASVVQQRRFSDHAQDAIKVLEDECRTDLERLRTRSMSALASFSVGDVGEAIDTAESALSLIGGMAGGGLAPSDGQAFSRVSNALYSSLAYYHADIIGSHEGDKRGSTVLSGRYLLESRSHYGSVGIPVAGLSAMDTEILSAISDADTGQRTFQALDNEAFVVIQTAGGEEEVRRALARMYLIHNNRPSTLDRLSPLTCDYHDYCARLRLAEIEASSA